MEDDELVRLIIVEYLKEAGFDVIEAFDAAHALALLKDIENPIDLLLTDIQMPGEMDGIALADYFLRHHPDVPVILTSGATQPVLAAQHHSFIPKPYELHQMEAHVRRLVY